jgi:hypothetical protein
MPSQEAAQQTEATMPSKAEWEEIKARLNTLYLPVYLDCDGYLVKLMLARTSNTRLSITVYVNGYIKGSWFSFTEPSEEGRRFYQERSRALYRGEKRKLAKRAFGKRAAEETFKYRVPSWSSATSLQRHYVKHNRSIKVVAKDEAEKRLALLSVQDEGGGE